MNLEVWPQNKMMAPASTPHQSPRTQGAQRAARDSGGSSRLPPMISQTVLIDSKVFMAHPKKRRLKKKTAVCKSMQKNAQPRFTMVKVSAQAASLPAREGECRLR